MDKCMVIDPLTKKQIKKVVRETLENSQGVYSEYLSYELDEEAEHLCATIFYLIEES